MTADSRILLIESVIQAGNIDETSASLDFPERLRSIDDKLHSFHPIQAPAPLSSNFGCAEKANLQVDVGMASWFNGSDRTLPQLREVATAAGLEVREVIYTRSFHSSEFCACDIARVVLKARLSSYRTPKACPAGTGNRTV